MTNDEFRAIVAAGPTVVMVENGHMLSLLDDRDRLAAEVARLREALGCAVTYVELTYSEEGGEEAEAARRDLARCRAALAPTRTDGGDA